MTKVYTSILGIRELKWMGMGEFNSDDHYIHYCGQESLRRKKIAFKVNKRVWNSVLGCSFRNDRMISVHFQGKPFNITVIQVFAPTTNAKEAEVEWFYDDLTRPGIPCKEKFWNYIQGWQAGRSDVVDKHMSSMDKESQWGGNQFRYHLWLIK